MSADPARHLQPVHYDSSTGEVCPNCAMFRKERDGLEKDLRAWRVRYADLAANKEQKAKEHRLFPEAIRAFEHWKVVCRHRRSDFTTDRFWLVEPFLRNTKKYGYEMVIRAIDGAALQSWVSERSNGSLKLHNDWKAIFASTDNVEERANRAPRGWTLAVSADMEGWSLGVLAKNDWGGLIVPESWKPPATETETGQIGLAIEEESDEC